VVVNEVRLKKKIDQGTGNERLDRHKAAGNKKTRKTKWLKRDGGLGNHTLLLGNRDWHWFVPEEELKMCDNADEACLKPGGTASHSFPTPAVLIFVFSSSALHMLCEPWIMTAGVEVKTIMAVVSWSAKPDGTLPSVGLSSMWLRVWNS
jgi:hypothetical protein